MKFFKKLFIFFNILTVLATAVVYLTSYVHPGNLWIFSTAGLLYPMLFFINCFFILYWLFQDVKWMTLSALVVLVGWNYTTGFIGINNDKNDIDKEDLSVVSYNTHFFAGASGTNDDYKIAEVIEFFDRFDDLDVICFQEFNVVFKEDFLRRFKGYRYISMNGKRTAIFSKYPVVNSGEVDFGTRTNSCVWADIEINEDTVRVYSIHLKSNNITRETDNVLENIDIQEKSTWKGARNIIAKYRKTAISRAEQAALVRKNIENCPYPVILAGDFNEPPSSYTYHLLSEEMKDSFRERGGGIGSTYAGRIPFLRIDYILVDKTIDVIGYQVYDISYSDHFPIHSTMRIPEK